LNGLTRQTVIALAARRGIKVVERHIEAAELAGFSEVFITGTAAEVTPVSEIGPHKFTPGQISHGLMADYDAEVRKP
jgi:branched-chain amino acid aminotransferase